MDWLSNLNLNKNELQNARLQNLATHPASPVSGQIYFNSTDKTIYGYSGTAWVDLGQVLTGASIVTLINASDSLIDDNNLSAAVNDALTKRHSHSNQAILDAIQVAFTTAMNTKLSGIADGANKVEDSTTNGNIKINGAENIVYTHPGTGTNPHGTTKADVGLSVVENKTSATIRSELTSADVTDGLGFTPIKNGGTVSEIDDGLESARPTATGSGKLYLATDTKMIWKDTAVNVWTKMGGQDTISWNDVTDKPTEFSTSIASATNLGGIKVGANLSIATDGTLNANDNPASFIRKQERFTVTAGQTIFDLTKGVYQPNTGAITWFLDGDKQDDDALIETSSTRVTLPAGLSEGANIMFEFYEVINWHPFPGHASEHLPGGVDPIPSVTTTSDGLATSAMLTKLNGIEAGAEVNDPAFKTIAVAGQTSILADLDADTLTLAAGTNVTITTDATTDTITISAPHPTGDGNLHVPATGTTNNGKVLKAGDTAGSLLWGTLTPTDVGAVPISDVVTSSAANKLLKLDANGKLPASITGNADGNAATATKLQNGRTFAITGDGSGTSAAFDGSGNASIPLVLANSGVTAGTYGKVTVDAKGRVTAGTSLVAGDIPTLTLSKISDSGTAASKNTGTASGNVPILDANGKLDTNILPAIAIVNTSLVASDAAMIALVAEPGDVAIRTDIRETFILKASPASTLANWEKLLTPTDTVTSVAGKTGVVTLTKSDVGLANVDNESKASMFTNAALTGTPTAPTASAATNTTQIATTAYVKSQNYAPLASPALTGVPTAPTASAATNNTQLATTAYVKSQGYITSSGAPVQSVAGKTGAVILVKGDVGLSNVEDKSSATIRSEITAGNVTTALGYTPAEKKTATIGDGVATQFTIAHNLGTQDVTVTVREAATPFSMVFADIQMIDANNIKVLFGAAPTTGQYRVVITG